MKKIAALILSIVMLGAFAGCAGKDKKDVSDSEYVKEKGKLVVGMTEFKPMDYKENGSDEWIGFDADMAKAFAKSLGVEVEFVEINWDNKVFELKNKSVDCLWNGMTITEDIKKMTSPTAPYCNNAQVIVVPKDKADKYKTAEACKDLKFAVETGSAGEAAVKALGYKMTALETQADALMEVASGTSDACVIDLLMAGAMIGEGTSYEKLTYTVSLTTEEYGVAFRKNSDLTEKLNQFFKDSYADGSMMKIAKKYGVQESIVEK